ncbi:MAG TPA: hypothetical protein VF977_10605 [Candidatus Binatia bacterium]
MENSGRLFEGDVVAPDQFLEIFTRGRNLLPEKELMLAILSDAIECILKYCEEPIPLREKLFRDAHDWLFEQDEKEPFSFLNICEALNFDPSYLRRGVLEKMRVKSVNAAPRLGRREVRLKRLGGAQSKLQQNSVAR